MKLKIVNLGMLLVLTLFTATQLPAAAVEGTSSGIFDNVTPVDQALYTQYPGLLSGEGTNNVGWGLPYPYNPSGPKSELQFAAASVGAEIGDVFSLGTLNHINRAIFIQPWDTRISDVDLIVTFSISSPAGVADVDFTVPLEVITTPNTGVNDDDFLVFPEALPTYAFSSGGTDYMMELLGFGEITGEGEYTTLEQFVLAEGDSTSAQLLARVTIIDPEPEPEPIPAPTSLILAIIGVAGSLKLLRKKTD